MTNLHSATVSLQEDGIGVGKKAELVQSSDSESSNGEERVLKFMKYIYIIYVYGH
jgi:RIO-like serine/threonine protein kinase